MKPWITPDIQNLIKLRDRLFERKKRQPENDHVREVYNRVRNRVSRQLEKSKKQHYESYFDEMNTNIKKTWEGIRKIVNVKKSTKFSISHLNMNGKIVDEPVDIANNFNNFFVNVGPETEKTVPRIPNQSPTQFLKNRNQFDFIVAHISEEDIIDIIVALPRKSIGPHSIPGFSKRGNFVGGGTNFQYFPGFGDFVGGDSVRRRRGHANFGYLWGGHPIFVGGTP